MFFHTPNKSEWVCLAGQRGTIMLCWHISDAAATRTILTLLSQTLSCIQTDNISRASTVLLLCLYSTCTIHYAYLVFQMVPWDRPLAFTFYRPRTCPNFFSVSVRSWTKSGNWLYSSILIQAVVSSLDYSSIHCFLGELLEVKHFWNYSRSTKGGLCFTWMISVFKKDRNTGLIYFPNTVW